MSLRFVPPAGAPIRARDLTAWARSAISSDNQVARLHQIICDQFSVGHSFTTSTGRAGMTILLKALRRLAADDRIEVVIPSYTCYSVAASVVKAGLRPRLVDVVPETLDFAREQLEATDFRRVLAVIATNLYGLPNDMSTVTRIARQHGAFVVDDAAQAMGASVGGRWSGTWGDVGLYSFDKGKNVSAITGGVIVTDTSEIAAAVDAELRGLQSTAAVVAVLDVAKALAYSAMLRPSLYGVPARLPMLGLGKTVYTTDYPLERPSGAIAALASVMMRRLSEFTAIRRSNGASLAAGLQHVPGAVLPAPASDAKSVYLRFPVLMPDRATRDEAISMLTRAGIGATGSYPQSLGDIPELRPHLANPSADVTGGRQVADRILTLPTHPFVSSADISVMTDVLMRLMGSTPRAAIGAMAHGAAGTPR
jgi:perosamine synthetase